MFNTISLSVPVRRIRSICSLPGLAASAGVGSAGQQALLDQDRMQARVQVTRLDLMARGGQRLYEFSRFGFLLHIHAGAVAMPEAASLDRVLRVHVPVKDRDDGHIHIVDDVAATGRADT